VLKTTMTRTLIAAAAIAVLCAPVPAARAQAQGAAPAAPPDLSGSYKCEPDPTPCHWPGPSPSISQTGKKVEIKNDKGEIADGTMTSDITLVIGGPFNSLGTVRPDHSISWSDGTKWTKQ
jgi:hypothetical protein